MLKDISNPNAAINPDAIGSVITLKTEESVTGTRLSETADELEIAQVGGKVAKLKKSQILKTEPMSISLMPEGLDKALTPEELRDLMTYLLIDPPTKKSATTTTK